MNTFEERMKTIKLYIQSCYNKGVNDTVIVNHGDTEIVYH